MIREATQGPFTVSAPGSICLLGEELAPLGLRTIHMAVNLRVYVKAQPRTDGFYRVERDGSEQVAEFAPQPGMDREGYDDPLRRAIHLLARSGMEFAAGFDFQIAGDMPPDIGLGYEAAMMVAWITTLVRLHGRQAEYSAHKIAALAAEAAWVDVDEPMDAVGHMVSAVGGINHVDHGRDCALTPITRPLDGLIVADVAADGEAAPFSPVRAMIAEADRALQERSPAVDLRTSPADDVFAALSDLPEHLARAAYAVVVDRGVADTAHELLTTEMFDQDAFGEQIDMHHEMLRDHLGIVVPQIERAIEVCKDARALGCKINLARGRTLTVYAPGRTLQVAAALREAAIRPYPVTKTHGVTFED